MNAVSKEFSLCLKLLHPEIVTPAALSVGGRRRKEITLITSIFMVLCDTPQPDNPLNLD